MFYSQRSETHLLDDVNIKTRLFQLSLNVDPVLPVSRGIEEGVQKLRPGGQKVFLSVGGAQHAGQKPKPDGFSESQSERGHGF